MILVTGATGFLGSTLVNALVARGVPVRALGRDATRLERLAARGADTVRADLRDRDAVIAACLGARAVVHCGALSSPWGSRRDFFDINVGGTQHVVDGCLAGGVERVVHISSPSVTFDGRDHINQTERTPYAARFTSAYAWSKKLAEGVVCDGMRRGLRAIVLRPKAIFGAGDTALLPRVLSAAKRGRLRQIGDGRNLVDLTYVDNVVHAILLALDSDRAIGGTYIVTNGEHVPLWDVIRRVLSECKLDRALHSVPLHVALTAALISEAAALITKREPVLTRYGVMILARTQTYDIRAAQRDLDYAPLIDVDGGLRRTLTRLHAGSEPKHGSARDRP